MEQNSRVKTLLFRKCRNMGDLDDCIKHSDVKPSWYTVSETKTLSEHDYSQFIENLISKDYDWLERAKGVILVTDGTNSIVVDNQGYSYARYVGKIVELT